MIYTNTDLIRSIHERMKANRVSIPEAALVDMPETEEEETTFLLERQRDIAMRQREQEAEHESFFESLLN